MRVEHRLTVYARCPVDDRRDVYTMMVRTSRTIKVEDILAAIADHTKEPIYQEELTKRLSKAIGCEVEMQGWHREVFTTVVCGGSWK